MYVKCFCSHAYKIFSEWFLKFNANKVALKLPMTRSSRTKVAIKYNVFTNDNHITVLIRLQR